MLEMIVVVTLCVWLIVTVSGKRDKGGDDK